MLVGEVSQTPLFCIFQCRLRVPAGRFLPGDALRVVEDLHEVRCSFCQRSILHLFRDRRIQKRNAPFLHTFRKLLLRQQCSLPAHLRGSVSVQNVGNMKSAVAIFRSRVTEYTPSAVPWFSCPFFHKSALPKCSPPRRSGSPRSNPTLLPAALHIQTGFPRCAVRAPACQRKGHQ